MKGQPDNRVPILRTRGLTVVDQGVDDLGRPWLRLAASSRSRNRVRSVIVYILAEQPSRFMYAYSYIDEGVLITKYGPYGDPELDTDGPTPWLSLDP